MEQVVVPEQPDRDTDDYDCADDETIVITERIKVYPPAWMETFGLLVQSIGKLSLLEEQHYAGDWDILRPAKELEEMNILTADDLAELMHEAETIMEGWAKKDDGREPDIQ